MCWTFFTYNLLWEASVWQQFWRISATQQCLKLYVLPPSERVSNSNRKQLVGWSCLKQKKSTRRKCLSYSHTSSVCNCARSQKDKKGEGQMRQNTFKSYYRKRWEWLCYQSRLWEGKCLCPLPLPHPHRLPPPGSCAICYITGERLLAHGDTTAAHRHRAVLPEAAPAAGQLLLCSQLEKPRCSPSYRSFATLGIHTRRFLDKPPARSPPPPNYSAALITWP